MSRRRTLTGTLLSTTAALALVAGASPALAHSPQPSTGRDIARAQVQAGVPVPVFASRLGRVPPAEAEARYYADHVTDQPAGSQNPEGA